VMADQWLSSVVFSCPPFAVALGSKRLLVAGGGGDSRTGVPNHLGFFDYSTNKFKKLIFHSTESKTIFCLGLHPKENVVACGVGDECWLYKWGTKEEVTRTARFKSDTSDPAKSKIIEQKVVAFSPDGKYLMTAGTDGYVRIWKTEDDFARVEKVTEVVAFSGKTVKVASWSPDGQFVLVVQDQGDGKIYQVERKESPIQLKQQTEIKPSDGHGFNGCKFGKSNSVFFTTEIIPRKSGKLSKWILNGSNCTLKSVNKVVSKAHITVMEISHCGNYIGIGTAGTGEVIVVNSNSMKTVMKVKIHELAVTNLCFSIPKLQEESNKKGGADPGDQEKLAVISCGLDNLVVCTIVKEKVSVSMLLIFAISFLVAVYAILVMVFK